MPTLVAFERQGRSQPIRYAMAAAGKEFEDIIIDRQEWPAIKEAGTYGPDAQLPLWKDDNGKTYTQTFAMLKKVCADCGFEPKNTEQLYLAEFCIETKNDILKADQFFNVLLNPEADEAAIESVMVVFRKLMDFVESQAADGRKFLTGDTPTFFDFDMLYFETGFYTNDGLRSAGFRDKLRAYYAGMEHTKRVTANLRALGTVQSVIDNLPVTFC